MELSPLHPAPPTSHALPLSDLIKTHLEGPLVTQPLCDCQFRFLEVESYFFCSHTTPSHHERDSNSVLPQSQTKAVTGGFRGKSGLEV